MSGGGIFLHCHLCYFFFFKQKTAYELRISDWSSDVCSSDLTDSLCQGTRHRFGPCRSRHERRQHRRTSRAGTYGRYGIELRGRAQSPISHLARHQESLRRNGRNRRLFNGVGGVGGSCKSFGPVPDPSRRKCHGRDSIPGPGRYATRSRSEEHTSELGRAHVCTPVTNAHLVCRLHLEKKK